VRIDVVKEVFERNCAYLKKVVSDRQYTHKLTDVLTPDTVLVQILINMGRAGNLSRPSSNRNFASKRIRKDSRLVS
jgi:hypothetical protein